MTPRSQHLSTREGGIVLIEVMVAALLFVVGLLGLLRSAGVTAATQSDVQLRTEASQHVSSIIDTISLNVDRTSEETLATSLALFSHRPAGNNCDFSGDESTQPLITTWVARITQGAIVPPANAADPTTRLPGSTAAMQQIVVNAANSNEVTVRLCWRSSNDAVARQHVMRAFIN